MRLFNKYIDVGDIGYNTIKGLAIILVIVFLIFILWGIIINPIKNTFIVIGYILLLGIISYLVGYFSEKMGIY